MNETQKQFVLVIKTKNPKFDMMGFMIARSWLDNQNADIAIYLKFDSVELMRKENIENTPELKAEVDYLLSKGVPIYVCGFCSRACDINKDSLYPGIELGNRNIFYSLMSERKAVYF